MQAGSEQKLAGQSEDRAQKETLISNVRVHGLDYLLNPGNPCAEELGHITRMLYLGLAFTAFGPGENGGPRMGRVSQTKHL